MASFATIGVLARRRATHIMARHTQKRTHLGEAPPPPEWTGVDKVVRSYMPFDYQIAAAILGVYTGFFGLYKIKSAITKKPVVEEVPVKVASTSNVPTGSIPDVDSPEFEKFLENVLENEDQLKALLEKFN